VTAAAPWSGVEPTGGGWSVPPTVAELAAAIGEATRLESADLEAMGRRARDWVREEYAWSNVARRHLSELYGWRGSGGGQDAACDA
jgi:glycosyltransferase involved in cell wall biosynthesis